MKSLIIIWLKYHLPTKKNAIKVFSLTYIIMILTFSMLFLACDDDVYFHDSEDCISGIIVGEKCGVIAFRPDKKDALSAQMWEKEVSGKQNSIKIENVIGIIGLTIEYKENQQIFLKLRKATEEEQLSLACYQDLPGPPRPMYVVIDQSLYNCPNQ